MAENTAQLALAPRKRGRPSLVRRTLERANGLRVDPLYAATILRDVIDERRAWQRVFNSEDDRIVLQAMMFLVSMRDGKPSQQINVTSTNVNISADSIAKARAIVAEIRGHDQGAKLINMTGTPRLGERSESIMLSGDEGGKREGDR